MDAIGGGETASFARVLLCGVKVNFKLDTGAEITAISDQTFKRLSCRATLQKSSKDLYGPGQQPLEVMGQFTSNMIYNGLQSEQVVFVMKGLKKNLLGLPALTALQLVSRDSELLGVNTRSN
ncbi:hypothetical protein EMCRGX_G020311 [Ephydatia muelleri]